MLCRFSSMAELDFNAPPPRTGSGSFASTHWSVVLLAGATPSPAAREALEKLCRAYWYPLYVFVRRQGHGPNEAQDLTQGFFAHLLADESLGRADPDKGRFRSFLIGALKHFLINEWQREHRQKRGGGCVTFSLEDEEAEARFAAEPADEWTPERAYDRRWAEALLEQVLEQLGREFADAGLTARFEALKVFLLAGPEPECYAAVAARLGLSESAAKSAIHRLRQRYGELIRAEIAQTVADPAEMEAEMRHLFSVLCG